MYITLMSLNTNHNKKIVAENDSARVIRLSELRLQKNKLCFT